MATKAEVLERHDVLIAVDENAVPPESLTNFDALHANGDGQSRDDAAEAARNRDRYAVLKAAEHDVDLARAEARQCRQATLAARTAFAKALEVWNRAQPIQTQNQAIREYINTSQAERARRAAAGQGIFHPGITRTAKAMAGGNQRRGGGDAYKRGVPGNIRAYSRREAATIEANRLRAAAATKGKPPS